MQDTEVLEITKEEVFTALTDNGRCLKLTYNFENISDEGLDLLIESVKKMSVHNKKELPVTYEFDTSTNIIYWLSYNDKSVLIGIDVPIQYSLAVAGVFELYSKWYEERRLEVSAQFLKFANQLPTVVIDGFSFIPNLLVESFCDWYISKHLGSIDFNIDFSPNGENGYFFILQIGYFFIDKKYTPAVLQRHILQFLKDEVTKYNLPPTELSTPPAPKEIEVIEKKVGRPESPKVAKRNSEIYKELLRLTETRTDAEARPLLLTTFKKYFNKEYETNRRNLDRIIQKMRGR